MVLIMLAMYKENYGFFFQKCSKLSISRTVFIYDICTNLPV